MKKITLGFILILITSNIFADFQSDCIDHLLFYQTLKLTKIDIYDCTKYGIEKFGHEEGNPWAAYWIDKGKYDELFAIMMLADASLYIGSFIWQNQVINSNIQPTWKKEQLLKLIKFLRRYYLVMWGITEVYAISTWGNITVNFEYYIYF